MASELTVAEQIEAYRSAIVALLAIDPHCPLANSMGRLLMDLMEDI